MSTRLKFSTVEELVAEAVHRATRKYGDPTTYGLVVRTEQEYVDEAAGKIWDEQMDALRDKYRAIADAMQHPGEYIWYNDLPEFKQEREVLDATQPPKHKVTYRWLDASKHGVDIELLGDLGAAVEGIWKKDPRYSFAFKGRLSLAGIVKRLGTTGLESKIKAAKAAEELEIAKRNRNYARKQLRDALEKLGDAVAAANQLGVFSDPAAVNTTPMGTFQDLIGDDES